METDQTPEDGIMMSELNEIIESSIEKRFGSDITIIHGDKIANEFLKLHERHSKSLQSEIERLNKVISEYGETMDNLNGQLLHQEAAYSCPSCDSMAERIKELEDSIIKLGEWNKKYPPGRVYPYGEAATMEKQLTECINGCTQLLNNRKEE